MGTTLFDWTTGGIMNWRLAGPARILVLLAASAAMMAGTAVLLVVADRFVIPHLPSLVATALS